MNEFERLHVELSRLADEMRRASFGPFGAAAHWRPAVNAYRLSNRFLICVDLAGMHKPAIAVRAEARRLLISGTRPPPEPPRDTPSCSQTLAMEIDYGPFQRTIELPEEVDAEAVTATYCDGLLWITMPLRRASAKPGPEKPQ